MNKPTFPAFAMACAALSLLLAACGGESDVASTTTNAAPPTTATPATTTTAPPTTTGAPSSTTTSTTTTAPPAPAPADFFIGQTDSGDVVSISLQTGEIARTIVPGGEGWWMGAMHLMPDASRFYSTRGFEDYWFSCEASKGEMISVGPNGDIEDAGSGFAPVPSFDGTSLLSIAASECFPDPEQPESWVLAPADTIVVRNIETGSETRLVVPLDGDAPAMDHEFVAAVWDGAATGAYVLDRTGAIRHFTLDGDAAGEERAIAHVPGDAITAWSLHGFQYTPKPSVIVSAISWRDENPFTEVYRIGDDGTVELIRSGPGIISAAVDRTGQHLLLVDQATAIWEGGQVTLQAPITNIAW